MTGRLMLLWMLASSIPAYQMPSKGNQKEAKGVNQLTPVNCLFSDFRICPNKIFRIGHFHLRQGFGIHDRIRIDDVV